MDKLNLREVISENIRVFRKEEGISQEEFAARCGLHRTYVGSVERMERNVTLDTLDQFSGAMGVSAAELLTPRATKGDGR